MAETVCILELFSSNVRYIGFCNLFFFGQNRNSSEKSNIRLKLIFRIKIEIFEKKIKIFEKQIEIFEKKIEFLCKTRSFDRNFNFLCKTRSFYKNFNFLSKTSKFPIKADDLLFSSKAVFSRQKIILP